MASHSHISTVHEKASHSHMSTVHDKISIMESRQGSKTSVIEGLDDEHSDTFRYTIAPNNHLNTFRNSGSLSRLHDTGLIVDCWHMTVTGLFVDCWNMTCHFVDSCFVTITPSSGSFTGLFEYSLAEMYKWIKLWCVLNQLICRIVYSPW
jgi:hypothetical protein